MTAFVTVGDMMAALSALPSDALLVMTHDGYYCYSELADVCLPEAHTMESYEDGLTKGTVVYSIGHSCQNY